MMIRLSGAPSRCLAGSALGGLIALTFVPAATAQWLPPPWRAAFPGEIARSLEARGYVLTAPLLRRPGIYIADVSAGPAGYQRLIVDARSGQVLQSFPASGRMWGPTLAARGEEFGEPPPRVGPPLKDEFSSVPVTARAAKPSSGGLAGVHIPAAISPYGPGAAPVGTTPKTKTASVEHKSSGTKTPITNAPLPPPAPRKAAKADEPGPPMSEAVENPNPGSDQLRLESRPAEVDNAPQAAPPATQGSTAEASDKPKVSIVPPAPFE
jgi:hypothetical protein